MFDICVSDALPRFPFDGASNRVLLCEESIVVDAMGRSISSFTIMFVERCGLCAGELVRCEV